jgi:hypothetical protein
MKSPRRPRQTDAWKAAEVAGCDMKQLAYNLTLTPVECIQQHRRKLAALLAEEAAKNSRRKRHSGKRQHHKRKQT